MEKQSSRRKERQLQLHDPSKESKCIPFRFNGKLKAKGMSKKRAEDDENRFEVKDSVFGSRNKRVHDFFDI